MDNRVITSYSYGGMLTSLTAVGIWILDLLTRAPTLYQLSDGCTVDTYIIRYTKSNSYQHVVVWWWPKAAAAERAPSSDALQKVSCRSKSRDIGFMQISLPKWYEVTWLGGSSVYWLVTWIRLTRGGSAPGGGPMGMAAGGGGGGAGSAPKGAAGGAAGVGGGGTGGAMRP